MGRPIDPNYPSNLFAVAVTVTTGLGFALYNLFATEALPTSPFAAAVAVFIAWAIGREIDPDNNRSAAYAMGVSALYSLFAAPSLLVGAGVLMATRLISGTVGIGLKPIDKIVLLGLGAVLGAGAVSLAVLPGLAAAIVIIGDRSRSATLLAAATTATGAAAFAILQPEAVWSELNAAAWAVAAIVAAALVFAVPAAMPVAATDVGMFKLDSWRITLSRIAAAATMLVAVAITGRLGVEQTAGTIGAAVLGVALARWTSTRGRVSDETHITARRY